MPERLAVNINDECANALRRIKVKRGIDTTEAIRRAISLLDRVEQSAVSGEIVPRPTQARDDHAPRRAMCVMWQDVRGQRTVFSCECAGKGCPDEPPRRRDASNDDHLSWWDATRFAWHFRWHPDHAETLWHDFRAGLTRCACGKTWGKR